MNDNIRKISLDIETIENEKMIPFLPEPEVALGNTKDPEKIKAKREEAKRKQIEKMALDPTTGRICAVGIYSNHEQDRGYHVIDNASDTDEIVLLNEILKYLKIGNDTPTQIITCNGTEFDLPYIYKRAMILKIGIDGPICTDIETKGFVPRLKYWIHKQDTGIHYDIQKVWKGFKNTFQFPSNLDYLSRMVLGVGKTERDYSEYSQLIRDGEGDKIGVDAFSDAQSAYRLHEKFTTYLWE